MNKIIWLLSLVVLSGSLVSCSSNAEESTTKREEVIKVRARKIVPENVDLSKTYFAKANYHKSMTCVAEVAGQVLRANAKAGQRVKQGEILFAYPPINHELEVEQARLTYKELKDTYERHEKLYKIGSVAKVELKRSRTQMEVQQKALERLEKQNVIVAPFSGVVTDVFVYQNQEVAADDKICTIANTDKLKISFFVPVSEIDQIQIGNKVKLEYRNNKYDGVVSEKAIQMHPVKKQYHVEASFVGVNNFSVSGATMSVEVVTAQKDNAIVIPRSATKKKKDGYYAFFVKNQKAISKKLKNTHLIGMDFLVEDQVKAGEMLVVEGVDKIFDGVKVELIK